MGSSSQNLGTPRSGGADFRTTHWSLVLAAAEMQSASGEQALAQLCQAYWYPLYAFIRRRGHDAHEAEDLTQEFFAQLLAKNYLHSADRDKGRFRTFLLAAVGHFLANDWKKKQTIKRGGRCAHISWDATTAEERYRHEPSHSDTAEATFNRNWALTLLEKVMAGLRTEYAKASKLKLFEVLQSQLTGSDGAESYADAGARLNLTEGAARVSAHRMRRRFVELLRAEIAQTVSDPEEIEEELRGLFAALA